MSRLPSRNERRRVQFARRFDSIEAMEQRNLITESLGILTAGIGVATAVVGRADAASQAQAVRPSRRPVSNLDGTTALPFVPATFTAGGGSARVTTPPVSVAILSGPPSIAAAPSLDYAPAANVITVAGASTPTDSPKAGGAGGTSHGGSGALAPAASPAPAASSPAGSSAPGGSSTPTFVVPATLDNGPSPSSSSTHPTTSNTHNATAMITMTSSPASSGGSLHPNAMATFASFPVYTLDNNAGSVLLPGTERLATLGAEMDLRAQVEDTTVASYSWNTSGLTDATAIAGANTYDLTFQWDSSVSAATTNSATLTVTNSSGQTQVQTYTFQVPSGSGTAGTGTAAWPQSLSPDTVSPSAPSFDAHDASIDANSGSLDTSITLPSYNPNVPALVLSYDSVTASPQPIITVPHTLDPTQAVPSQVSAQLTFDGTAGATTYYNSSQLTPGDVQQIAAQANASSLATGRYPYSVSIGDIRGTTTTTTVTGSTTVINDSGSALGAGWEVNGLERIIPAAGGVILDLGSGGKSLWFANGSGSTYVDPAGEFSTLTANSGGTYTDTLTDGTVFQFNSSGQETSALNPDGVGPTYAYDNLGRLSTISDVFGNATTFAYSGSTGLLQTITDPAGRVTSFAHSGTAISGVTLPDSSIWSYASNGSGRVTTITDPDGHAESVAYDAAGRVGGITNPDSTTESFVPAEEQGFVPAGSGTASSPATPTLLAQASATYTDPLGNVTNLYPDWQGLGLTDVTADPMANVASIERDGNGLARIAVDPMNRITQYAHDAYGNLTQTINPDGTTTLATYNNLAEPLTKTDELGRETTYTYDSLGNQTSMTDPLGNVTNDAYNSFGEVSSQADPSPDTLQENQVGTGETTSNTYNAQGELTRTQDPDGDVTSYTYDSAGDRTAVTDPDGHQSTVTYDAMGRVLTTTDALNHTTTTAYDADGNPVSVTDALGHATITAYDAMGRIKTVTDADVGVTTYAYDADGHQTSITDSVGNKTSYTYDADGNPLTTTNPNGYVSSETYDADGEVTSSVDADGRQTNYAYSVMGREVAETWIGTGGSAIETIATTYDADGETTAIADGTTTLGYTYDADGHQLTASTSGTGSGQPAVTLSSTYSQDGSLVGLADNLSSAGSTTLTYDAADRLTNLAATYGGVAGPAVALAYDATGNLTSITRTVPSGGTGAQTRTNGTQASGAGRIGGGGGSSSATIITNLAYDAANRVTSITDLVSGGPTLDAQTYGYDAANRMTSQTNAEGSSAYSYDNVNELIGVTGTASASYSYDANGNRTMAGYTTATGNETSAGAGYTYTYDHDGNMTSMTQASTGDVWTYTWDYRNRLTGVMEKTSGGTVLMQGAYTYDPMNRRIGVDETVSGTETKTYTVYDGVNPYADFNSSGALLVRYLYGSAEDQILARTSASGTTAWYLTDNEGSVRDVVSSTGTVTDHIAYDAYGNITSESSPGNGDRFKFDGMAWDTAIDLYYDNARYYNPTTGKFASLDSIGFSSGDTDLSRFVGNDPVNKIDPNGHLAILDGLKNWFRNNIQKPITGPGHVHFGRTMLNDPSMIVGEYGSITNPTSYWGGSQPTDYPYILQSVDAVVTPHGLLKIPDGTTVIFEKDPTTGLYHWSWGPGELAPTWYPAGSPNTFGDNTLTPGVVETK